MKMDKMSDREKVIKGLECCVAYDYKCNDCPYQDDGGAEDGCYSDELKADALALLKAHEPATVEPKRIELADETKAWLDTMDAVEALGNIADICIDWDGYRTANGLGGLINEIWAYARYCAKKLNEAQEPVKPIIDTHWETPSVYDNDVKVTENKCGACGAEIDKWDKYCRVCGRAVKWNDT